MRLDSTVEPIYFPEIEQQSVLRMGLHPLSLDSWIQTDDDYEKFYEHKLQQQKIRFAEVFRQIDDTQDCIEEFNNYLLANLLKHQSQSYELRDGYLYHIPTEIQFDTSTTSLWDSSLWIQEDICLLKQIDQKHVLVAASLCSPSNWKLQEKIGQTIEVIHTPVPGYKDSLSSKVDKLLSALKVDKPIYRYNWSVQQGNELYWDSYDDLGLADETPYWRVERQTLLRLPSTGAIVFGIRIYLHDFNTMAQDQQFKSNFRELINRQQPEMRIYKGLTDSLLERLQSK